MREEDREVFQTGEVRLLLEHLRGEHQELTGFPNRTEHFVYLGNGCFKTCYSWTEGPWIAKEQKLGVLSDFSVERYVQLRPQGLCCPTLFEVLGRQQWQIQPLVEIGPNICFDAGTAVRIQGVSNDLKWQNCGLWQGRVVLIDL